MNAYQEALLAHYVHQWGIQPARLATQRPSALHVPATFRVLEFAPIARKNHGYYATSLSRHGLNILRQITRPATSPHEPMAQMVDALLRWISCKIARYQPTK